MGGLGFEFDEIRIIQRCNVQVNKYQFNFENLTFYQIFTSFYQKCLIIYLYK